MDVCALVGEDDLPVIGRVMSSAFPATVERTVRPELTPQAWRWLHQTAI